MQVSTNCGQILGWPPLSGWRIPGDARDAYPPGCPNSFIFIQFLAKGLQNNPTFGKSWIRHCIWSSITTEKKNFSCISSCLSRIQSITIKGLQRDVDPHRPHSNFTEWFMKDTSIYLAAPLKVTVHSLPHLTTKKHFVRNPVHHPCPCPCGLWIFWKTKLLVYLATSVYLITSVCLAAPSLMTSNNVPTPSGSFTKNKYEWPGQMRQRSKEFLQ